MAGGSDYAEIIGSFVDGIIKSVLLLVGLIIILVIFGTYTVTKKIHSKEAVDKRTQYEETVKELTPKQREVLGL